MLTNSATTQVQIQGFEMANPNIYIMCEQLGFVKGPILLFQAAGFCNTG